MKPTLLSESLVRTGSDYNLTTSTRYGPDHNACTRFLRGHCLAVVREPEFS